MRAPTHTRMRAHVVCLFLQFNKQALLRRGTARRGAEEVGLNTIGTTAFVHFSVSLVMLVVITVMLTLLV